MARRNDPNDAPKNFLAIKGSGRFKVQPQTPEGRRASFIWTLILLAPTVPYVMLAAWVDDTPQEYWAFIALVPYLLLTGLIGWAMIRWMMERADVISPEELQDFVRNRRGGSNRTGR